MNNNKYLTAEQVINIIKTLAKAQGFYSSLYDNICVLEEFYPDGYESYKMGLEECRFKDTIDVIMFFEMGGNI